MDFNYFLKVLWKQKWLLSLLTVAAVVMTYFLVGLRPPVYKSNAILSTGITIDKNIDLSKKDVFVQKYELEYAFSNLIETMKSRTSIRLLSYELLLHDLTAYSKGKKTFRKISPEDKERFKNQKVDGLIRELNMPRDSISHWTLSREYDALFLDLAKVHGYDYESLIENLDINRIGQTDYLKIEFESEDPALCEYTVNVLSQKFIRYNKQMLNKDENEAAKFYSDLVKKKKEKVDQISNDLSYFRQEKNIVNVEKQTEAVVEQVKNLEFSREEAKKGMAGHRKNIASLNNYLEEQLDLSSDAYFRKSNLNDSLYKIHGEIKELKIKSLAENANKVELEKLVNAKRKKQEALISQLADKRQKDEEEYSNTLETLLEKRIDEEMELTLKEEGVASTNAAIEELQLQSKDLVYAESHIKMLESQQDIALQEYLQAVGKLNDAQVVAQSAINPLRIFEHAQIPEEPEPSKRLFFSAFAGAAAGSMGVFLLFFLTLFDNSLSSPSQFEKLVQVPLLGPLNQLKVKKLAWPIGQKDWHDDKYGKSYNESIRKIRHHIESAGAKRFLITSTKEKTGKSHAILSLAYSLSKKNKNVLVVDTNFKHNTLSDFANKEFDNNPLFNGHAHHYLKDKSNGPLPKGVNYKGKVDIIGNWPSNDSPSEILAGKDFNSMLDQFDRDYDFILLEGASLNEFSDSRELVDYAEKVIAVFDAPSSLGRVDKSSLEYLNSLGTKFMGGILNRVDLKNLN